MWQKSLLFSLLLFVLIGCDVRDRTPRVYDEWGRASLQGTAARGSEIDVATRSDGSEIMMAWLGRDPEDGHEVVQIHIIDNTNQLQNDFFFELRGESPDNLKLVATDEGAIVAWTVIDGNDRVLRFVPFGWNGDHADVDRTIAVAGTDVRWFSTKVANDGATLLFYITDENILVGERFDGEDFTPIFEQESVINADFQQANDDTLHIAWSEAIRGEQFLRYAQIINGERSITAEGLPLYAGDGADRASTITGPTVLLDDTHVYVSWNRRINTPAGSFLRIFYTAFALGEIDSAELISTDPAPIAIPAFYPPRFFPAESDTYPYTELSAVSTTSSLSGIAFPAVGATPVDGQRDSIAFATSILLSRRNSRVVQPATVFLDDGMVTGYQTLTWTVDRTGRPAISADENNNLYVVWTDAYRGDKPVYLISTQPEFVEATNSLTGRDVRVIAYELLNRMLQGFGLIFVVIPWILFPFFYFFFVVIVVSGETYLPRARNAFMVGIVLHLALKFWSGLSSEIALMRYLPNGGLLDPALYQTLIYAIPIGIMAISLLIAYLVYVRRAREVHHSTWFIIAVATDYILSLFFYAIEYFA